MDKDQLDLIREVLATVGSAGSEVISQYAKWHFVDNIVWVLFGVVLTVFGFKLAVKWKTEGGEEYILKGAVVFIVVLLGVSNVAWHLAGIYAPDAEAINRL